MATMKNKSVGFNIDDPDELDLFKWANAQPNFAKYVKDLMAKDKKGNSASSESPGIKLDLRNQPSGKSKPLLPGNQQR